MVFLAIIFVVFISNYLILYWVLLLYSKKKRNNMPINSKDFFISVVIPFRNEEKNLPSLIQSLICQNISIKNFEVIFIDDHSTDSSYYIIKDLMTKSGISFKLLSLKETYGKKNALETGFKASIGDIILQTDADVTFGPSWIKKHHTEHLQNDIFVLCGAVDLLSEGRFFDRIQQLEFMALMQSSYLTINANRPVMCNGANLSFKRAILSDVINSYQKIKSASGDDVFMLHQIKSKFGAEKIKYLVSSEGIVFTQPKEKLIDLIKQRSRWAKKSKEYKSTFAIYFTISIVLANLSILILLFSTPFLTPTLFAILVLIPFILKWLTDVLLILNYSKKFKSLLKATWLLDSIVLELIYPIYIIIVGINMLLSKQMWKGRVVR